MVPGRLAADASQEQYVRDVRIDAYLRFSSSDLASIAGRAP